MYAMKRTKCEGDGEGEGKGAVGGGGGGGGRLLDEDLNSRNLFTYGADAMSKMAASSVAVLGLNGVGAEAAKSLILANVGRVTLVDDATVAIDDLSTHFYLSASDVGLNRAFACCGSLQELNPNVDVSVCAGAPSRELFAEHDAIVVCDGSMAQRIQWNSICRECQPPVAFVMAQAYGACFRLFADFGDEFRSCPGDKTYTLAVAGIARSAAGCVSVTAVVGQLLPKKDDTVTFSDIPGASNARGDPVHFRILGHPQQLAADASLVQFEVEAKGLDVAAYAGNGYVSRVILPLTSHFSSLERALLAPGNLSGRPWKMFECNARSEQLHVAFAALNLYLERNSSFPNARDAGNMAEFLNVCREMLSSSPALLPPPASIDDAVMRAFARSSKGLLNPVAAIAGAVAAQEAIKSCSRKYIPVCDPQWFYFDAFDAMPDDGIENETEFAPQNCRYDQQIAVLGRSMQAALAQANVFVVGAGALGCEILKNFALMGVGCGDGLVTVTDNDHIEKSNLSRQFLFRSRHIKQSKSICARESILQINPEMNIKCHTLLLGHSTQHVFHDEFWGGVDVAVNALDTTHARKFVSDKCVRFAKPNIECSTQGLDCSAEAFLPFVTGSYETYSSDPNAVLPCTLKLFPYLASHCLQFAKGEFAFEFSIVPQPKNIACVLQSKSAPKDQDNYLLIVERIALALLHVTTFDQCLSWARSLYDEYVWRVEDSVLQHPQDEMEEGVRFWSAPKRFPCVEDCGFDWGDERCRRFVFAAAVLKAACCGVGVPDGANFNSIVECPPACSHPLFSQRSERGKVMRRRAALEQALEDAAVAADAKAEEAEIQRLVAIAAAQSRDIRRVQPVFFDKDNAAHMEFVLACAYLRMKLFKIKPIDKIDAIRIIGESMPAVSTATAVAAGLACLHFIRLFRFRDALSCSRSLPFEELEKLRNVFFKSSVSLENLQPAVYDAGASAEKQLGALKWSQWETWQLPARCRVGGLWEFLKGKGVNLRLLADVSFENLQLLNPASFSAPPGALLAESCRKKMKETMAGLAAEKRDQWQAFVAGKSRLEISILAHDARIVALGVGDSAFDLVVAGDCDASGAAVTVGFIKRQLARQHGVELSSGYCLRKLHADRPAGANLDDDDEIVEWGSSLLLISLNSSKLLQLPLVLLDVPPECITIDGAQLIPVNVKAAGSGSEQYFDLLLPPECSALQLKQLLRDAGVDWTLDASVVRAFGGKVLPDGAAIPAACDLPLKVWQVKGSG